MAHILLAEDDNAMRNFLKRSLERAGHTVISGASGKEALTFLKDQQFDLLLSDIVMPEMDGIELAQRAVGSQPDIKVLFITGFAAVAMQEHDRTPRDARIMSKPFHLKDIVDEIDRILAA